MCAMPDAGPDGDGGHTPGTHHTAPVPRRKGTPPRPTSRGQQPTEPASKTPPAGAARARARCAAENPKPETRKILEMENEHIDREQFIYNFLS